MRSPSLSSKHKVLTNELAIDPFVLDLLCIVDDASFEVIYIPETIVQHVGTGLFTPDTACAIHDDVLLLLILQHIYCHG